MERHIQSRARIPGIKGPVEIIEVGNPGQPTEILVHDGKLYVYNEDGQTMIDGGVIQGVAIAARAIATQHLAVGNRAFVTTVGFSATANNAVTWTSGTIYFSNQDTQSINGGSKTDIDSTTYLYTTQGSSEITPTTSKETAMQDSVTLLAIVEPVTDTNDLAKITVLRGAGTTIDGDQIVTGTINARRLNIGQQLFVTSVDFDTTSPDYCSWSAGDITLIGGETLSVAGGNTGHLAALTEEFNSDGETLALWHLNESVGNTCDNAEGDANWDGTASGASINNSGKFGRCREFDGTNDYISVADNAEMDQNSFTWEGWFKTRGSISSRQYIISRSYASGSTTERCMDISLNPYGYLEADIYGYSPASGSTSGSYNEYGLSSAVDLDDGEFHSFTVNFDLTTQKAELYVDQIKQDENENCEYAPRDSSQPIYIGKSDLSTAGHFDGFLDEIRFSSTNRTVSAADKRYVYYDSGSADPTALEVSTTRTDAIGSGKILLCIMTPQLEGSGAELELVRREGTTIAGDRVKTGRIESIDGKTFFDLNNRYIMMNDEDGNNRVLFGFQQGGF